MWVCLGQYVIATVIVADHEEQSFLIHLMYSSIGESYDFVLLFLAHTPEAEQMWEWGITAANHRNVSNQYLQGAMYGTVYFNQYSILEKNITWDICQGNTLDWDI